MMIGYVETYLPVGETPRARRNLAAAGAGEMLFDTLDTNGDGLLSKDEARKAADRAPRLKDRPEILERLFDRMDEDKDGKLSKDDNHHTLGWRVDGFECFGCGHEGLIQSPGWN